MIFLHCGLRKTGSTAIQEAAVRGRFSGVRYSRRARTELAEDHPAARWVERVVRTARSTTVLLSCENIFRRRDFRAMEPPATRAAQLLDGFGRDHTTLVIYVRPHLPWLESMYFQTLQNRNASSPSDFLREFLSTDAANISDKIRAIAGVAGPDRLVVRIHDGTSDVVADLARVMGVDLVGESPVRTNTSLAHRDIWTLAALNRRDPGQCWYAVDRLRRHPCPDPQPIGRQSVYIEREQEMIMARFAADWMALAPYVSAEGMDGEEALRASWATAAAGRPFAAATPDDEAELRADQLQRWLTSTPGYVDSRVLERLRQWSRLVESFRWRLKIGF